MVYLQPLLLHIYIYGIMVISLYAFFNWTMQIFMFLAYDQYLEY